MSLALLILLYTVLSIARGRLPADADPFALPPLPTYPAVSDLAPDAELDQRFASLSYGVHTFLWWNETYRTWDLENIRLMNFPYIKQIFAWENMQPERDVWDWSLADEVVAEALYRGRRIVARVDGIPEWALRQPRQRDDVPFDVAAFGEFCGTLAARYAGQIEAYQIWNEPNLDREWAGAMPSPKAYVEVLAACSSAIRAADPAATIISAGLAPTGTRNQDVLPDEEFLWEMYAEGASAHFDVLGLNAPGYSLPPQASATDAEAAGVPHWARFRHVEQMRAIMVYNGDAHKQIAILEMGWTTDTRPDSIYSWFGVSQERQAEYVEEAYVYAAENWRPWVGLITVIYISKHTWTNENEEWWWSLDEPTDPPFFKTMRPAYYALANMAKISDNPDFAAPPRRPDEGPSVEPLPGRN